MTTPTSIGSETFDLTFQIFCPVSVKVDPDPLGDVNCIIRMMRRNPDGTQTAIRSVLHPNRPGMKVTLGAGPLERPADDPVPWPLPLYIPMWYIAVDGKRVIEVFEHDTWPPPPPRPYVPWHRRARRAIAKHSRAVVNAIALKLGYTRTGHCDCGDDW